MYRVRGKGLENSIFSFKYKRHKAEWPKEEIKTNPIVLDSEFQTTKIELEKSRTGNGMRYQHGYYMDLVEVTNISWLEFLFSANRTDSMNIGITNFVPADFSIKNEQYFNNPQYYSYPVVGITYSMAQK